MIPEMAHQPKSKEINRNHPCIQAHNTKTKESHQMCTHKKLAKQQNNVLIFQITKKDLRFDNKGLYPKCEKV
jgi:hypothetical protein